MMRTAPERKIRVLQLIDGLTSGGAERIALILATKVNQDRFEIIPCALYQTGPLEEELNAAGVNYRVLNLHRRSVLTGPLFLRDVQQILATLAATLKELSIDILHTHLTESTLLGIIAARRMGNVKVCTSLHNIILHNQRGRWSPREWVMRTAINMVFSHADRIIAVSEEVARAALIHTHIPAELVVTIPNGVDPHRFSIADDKSLLRKKLGLPTDRPIVITVGRLTKQKGYPYLLDALAVLSAEERPFTVFAGDGPDRNELESQAAILALTHDICFLGNRYDIPELLAAADLFVLSSLWEGLPLALLEAMASKLAAVATDVGGNSEVVKHGESGLLVPPANGRALAEAMRSLLKVPAQRERMGQLARERFLLRFSLQSFVEAHEQVYEAMLAEDPARSQLAA